jgi:hypothetical protein
MPLPLLLHCHTDGYVRAEAVGALLLALVLLSDPVITREGKDPDAFGAGAGGAAVGRSEGDGLSWTHESVGGENRNQHFHYPPVNPFIFQHTREIIS